MDFKRTANILMSGHGNKCQNAFCFLITRVGKCRFACKSVSAVFEPQKEYKDSGIKFNEVCVERYTVRVAPNFVAVHNHRFMRSNNKRIVSTVRNLMIT